MARRVHVDVRGQLEEVRESIRINVDGGIRMASGEERCPDGRLELGDCIRAGRVIPFDESVRWNRPGYGHSHVRHAAEGQAGMDRVGPGGPGPGDPGPVAGHAYGLGSGGEALPL